MKGVRLARFLLLGGVSLVLVLSATGVLQAAPGFLPPGQAAKMGGRSSPLAATGGRCPFCGAGAGPGPGRWWAVPPIVWSKVACGQVVKVTLGSRPAIELKPLRWTWPWRACPLHGASAPQLEAETRRYEVSADAEVFLDGEKAELRDIEAGMWAALYLSRDGKAARVVAHIPPQQEDEGSLTGWLVRLPVGEGGSTSAQAAYGLVAGPCPTPPRVQTEPGKQGWRPIAPAAGCRFVRLVPLDEAVRREFEDHRGQWVEVAGKWVGASEGQPLGAFRVSEVAGATWPPE